MPKSTAGRSPQLETESQTFCWRWYADGQSEIKLHQIILGPLWSFWDHCGNQKTQKLKGLIDHIGSVAIHDKVFVHAAVFGQVLRPEKPQNKEMPLGRGQSQSHFPTARAALPLLRYPFFELSLTKIDIFQDLSVAPSFIVEHMVLLQDVDSVIADSIC